MKLYRNENFGFEISIPKGWSILKRKSIKTPYGEAIVFDCGSDENFNMQIGWSAQSPIEQAEQDFSNFASKRKYTDLVIGEIIADGKAHLWARYCMDTKDWAKKYLVYFGETEYAITGYCFDTRKFLERERTWDTIVSTFRTIPFNTSREKTSIIDRMNRAAMISDKGHSYFRSGKYMKALYQFEQGKLITHEFPWNFLGASMTLMQMIEVGEMPEEKIPMALNQAEKNIQVCLLINPSEPDYRRALNVIKEYKKKYNL